MNITNNPSITGGSPTGLHDTLVELRKTATESITKALTELETVNSLGATQGKDGVLQLAPPKGMMNVMDLTLRIGLLQDALNQLMQQVSKNEIEGRLNDLNRENKEQLDKMKDQMKHVEENVKKNQEAAKKSNIFQAIANFFKAIVNIIVAVFNVIAAVGYALTGNVVAAAGLAVSAVALLASAAIDIVQGIDSVVKAAGGKGFLSDADIERMTKASEILGYIAMGAAMIGGLGAIVSGVQQGMKLAATKLGEIGIQQGVKSFVASAAKEVFKDLVSSMPSKAAQETAKELAKKAMEEAIKNVAQKSGTWATEMATEVAKEAIKEAVKQTVKAAVRELVLMTQRTALVQGIGGGATQILSGVGEVVVGNIQKDAAAEKLKADQAEAQAKALEAMIQMLHKVIEQLQKDLSDMLDSMMQAVSAIFNAVDEASSSMKELMHFQPN